MSLVDDNSKSIKEFCWKLEVDRLGIIIGVKK